MNPMIITIDLATIPADAKNIAIVVNPKMSVPIHRTNFWDFAKFGIGVVAAEELVRGIVRLIKQKKDIPNKNGTDDCSRD